jgi:uncharacterized membrane protein
VEWLQVNFATGQVIGVAPDGGHQAAIEYTYVLDNPLNVASIAFIGTMDGFAVSQIKFMGLFLGGIASGKDLVDVVREAKLELSIDLAKDYIALLGGAIPVPESLPEWESLGAEIAKSIFGLAVKGGLFNPLQVGSEVIKLILGKTLPGFSNLSLAFDAGMVAGSAYGIYYIATTLPGDPPLFPALTAQVASSSPANFATDSVTVAGGPAPSHLASTVDTTSLAVSNQITASWSSSSNSGFQVSTLNGSGATVTDASGNAVGSGAVALAATTPIGATVSGGDQYNVSGTGSLSFYGPNDSRLVVAGSWTSYLATVSGTVSITLTTDGLTLNGRSLPAGTYTISGPSFTMAGSGPSTSPNFSGSASITATNDTIDLGPWTGTLAAGAGPLNPSSVATFTGYSGTITLNASSGSDAVTLNGGATDVLQASASPSALTTNENSHVTFQTDLQASLADTYAILVQAPTGWTVSLDASGKVTAVPAPGLQGGTYPIRIVATSTTDLDLVAQTTVDVTINPTQAGLALTVAPDPLFTVPFNGAQVPTAFRATIQNLGPAADTYNVTFSNVPIGFTIVESTTNLTVPAGQTGYIGVYLDPNAGQPLPPVGTQLSFTVTATSMSDSSITQTRTETFTMPAIDSVSLASAPTSLSSSPGVAATTTLTLQNDGNVPETVTLSAATPTGISANTLSPLTIAPGATQTETLTLTPAKSATLNQSLATTITATYGPSSAPDTTTDEVDVLVTSAQAAAVSQASIAAGAANNSQLSSVLSDLSSTLASLQAATSPALFTEVQNDLSNLSKLLAADPALASFASQIPPLANDAQSGDLTDLLANVATLFGSITGVLNVEATEQFTVTLTPVEIDLDLGQGETFSAQLTDTGNDPEKLNLSAGTLPSGVSVAFGQNSVSLTPGQTISVPTTLTQNLQSAADFELNVTASATVEKHTDSAMVVVSPAVADVLSVSVDPATVTAGEPVSVTAEVFNTANVTRSIQAQVEVINEAGTVVGTPTDVPVSLVPGAGELNLNLGQISTTGLGNGLYGMNVALITASGSPLPGHSSQSDFEIGQPVTATVAPSTTVVAPGTSTVTTTISVTNNSTAGPTTPAVTPYDNIEAFYASNEAQNIFGVGNLDGAIFAIENASAEPITDGILSINPPGGPSDSFKVGTVPAHNYVLVEPGISNDGGTNHTFFKVTGTLLDESDDGPNSNDTQFEFTGMQDGVAIDSRIFTPAATAGPSNDGKAPMVNFLGGPGDADVPSTDVFGPKVVATFSPESGGAPPPSPITVEVGYADDLRRNPYYPSPWAGSSNTVLVGENSSNNEDSGAIRIINNESTAITVNDVSVTLANGAHYDLWGSNVVPAGDSLILSQTNGQNFDSSDGDITLPYPQTYPDGETLHAAQINVTVNGVLLPTFLDTGHVLTTGGSDPGGPGVNESENWRPIGTTGEDNPGGLTATLSVTDNLPGFGYAVDPTTFSPAATSSTASQVVWNTQLPPATDSGPTAFALTGTVSDMAPGEVRQISTGSTVTATFATSAGQVLANTITLPPLLVAAEHIISIDPSTQTVDLAGTAIYMVSLTNPLQTDETYTLSTAGLAGLTVGLASSVAVPAGETVTTPLMVTARPEEGANRFVFTVNATTLEGGQDSVEGQLIVQPTIPLQSRAISLAINPTTATAGQGTSAHYTITVSNVGSVDDSYNLVVSGLPSGVTAALGQTTVDVPPGASNVRDVPLTLAVAPRITPGVYPFTVTAESTTDPTVTSTTGGTLTVTAGGVMVTLNPSSAAPGSGFQATVTNTGTTADTYDLALGGPAALVSRLGTLQVTLAPGASQVVPVTTGAVDFAVQGNLNLVAAATSTTNPAIQGAASASLAIPVMSGMTAAFSPTSQTLAAPGAATFLLTVHNTGNAEDIYSATIMTTSGPVTATLIGPDGSPTQSISSFRVPGLSIATIELPADLSAIGQGAVTVLVKSLDHPESATPTALMIVTPVTPPPSPGPQVEKVQRFGYHLMPTTLVVTFSEALDRSTAQDVRNYRIVTPDGHRIKVLRAVYDLSNDTVTLHLAERLSIHHPYRLTVIGTGQQGVSNPEHQLLNSETSDHAGRDYHLELTWRQLVLAHVSRGFLSRYHILSKGTQANDHSRDPRPKADAKHLVLHSTGLFTRSTSFPAHQATRPSHGQRSGHAAPRWRAVSTKRG